MRSIQLMVAICLLPLGGWNINKSGSKAVLRSNDENAYVLNHGRGGSWWTRNRTTSPVCESMQTWVNGRVPAKSSFLPIISEHRYGPTFSIPAKTGNRIFDASNGQELIGYAQGPILGSITRT